MQAKHVTGETAHSKFCVAYHRACQVQVLSHTSAACWEENLPLAHYIFASYRYFPYAITDLLDLIFVTQHLTTYFLGILRCNQESLTYMIGASLILATLCPTMMSSLQTFYTAVSVTKRWFSLYIWVCVQASKRKQPMSQWQVPWVDYSWSTVHKFPWVRVHSSAFSSGKQYKVIICSTALNINYWYHSLSTVELFFPMKFVMIMVPKNANTWLHTYKPYLLI